MSPNPARRPTPPSLAGMGALTFGIVAGFVVTALPFLLSRAGVSVDRIASVTAVAMSPTFWAFLVTPLVDVGMTRRAWAIFFTLTAAASLFSALFFFSPTRLPLFTALVLFAELSIVLQNSAVGGWVAEFAEDSQRGRIGGWTNVANLGGGAFGSMVLMSAAESLSFPAVAVVAAGAVLVSSLFLLGFPSPLRPVLGAREVFAGTFRSVVQTSRQPQVLVGFLMFLAPAGTLAAINLFAGLGNDFHAAPSRVVWVTGAGVAITSSLGALLGGWLADRMDRAYLYLAGAILAGLVSLALAFAPHTETAFVWGVLAYNGVAGMVYAAFSALSLQFTGTGNPTASTQLALFAAAANGAITYMTWFDGQGYRLWGVRGLFLVDGGAIVGAGLVLLAFVRRQLARHRFPRSA